MKLWIVIPALAGLVAGMFAGGIAGSLALRDRPTAAANDRHVESNVVVTLINAPGTPAGSVSDQDMVEGDAKGRFTLGTDELSAWFDKWRNESSAFQLMALERELLSRMENHGGRSIADVLAPLLKGDSIRSLSVWDRKTLAEAVAPLLISRGETQTFLDQVDCHSPFWMEVVRSTSMELTRGRNPEAAIQFCESLERFDSVEAERSWVAAERIANAFVAKGDVEALSRLLSGVAKPTGKIAEQVGRYLETVGGIEVYDALSQGGALSDETVSRLTFGFVTSSVTPEKVVARLDWISDPKLKEQAVMRLLGRWGIGNAEEAFRWIESKDMNALLPGGKDQARRRLIESFMALRPLEAVTEIERQFQGRKRDILIDELSTSVQQEDLSEHRQIFGDLFESISDPKRREIVVARFHREIGDQQ